MRKLLLVIVPIFLAVAVFAVLVYFVNKKTTGKGALQVTSVPQTMVYINGKSLGKTPLCRCDQQDMLQTGQYTIRLVPSNTSLPPYEDNITIYPSVLTVVDRTFGDIGRSTGSIISLSPNQDSSSIGLFVQSIPLGADISIDNTPSGQTPFTSSQITDSDHDLVLSKIGYRPKTVRVHTVKGYTLNVLAYLAVDLNAQLVNTASSDPQVIILETPTGFLRVRTEPDLSGSESARVNPGDRLLLLNEQDGWYQIQLPNGQTGWISASYAKKQ